MLIKAEGLSKVYGGGENKVTALHRANLQIAEGDFISIMGPSGSGKSTLLHLLSGLDFPTEGRLSYDGKDIYGLNDKELSAFRRRRIGFIFQQFHLLPVLTARENILMPLLLDRRQADPAYFEELAAMLGISDRLTHLPHELSGGQQQRVAIARALACGAPLILADEPTGSLDADTAAEIGEVLRENAHQLHKCVLAVTHSAALAAQADVVLSLEGGRLKIKNVIL